MLAALPTERGVHDPDALAGPTIGYRSRFNVVLCFFRSLWDWRFTGAVWRYRV
jgi:hypothetical protein